jgi:hypothetical protein
VTGVASTPDRVELFSQAAEVVETARARRFNPEQAESVWFAAFNAAASAGVAKAHRCRCVPAPI